MKENIALIGFMGSGKTTVGKALARALEMKFVDIDKEIVKLEKRTVAEIFEQDGEEYFREIERKIIDKESKDNNIVISTGGGVIIDNANIKKLKESSFVVYLNCDIDCIYDRVKNKKHRPLLNVDEPYKKLVELYNKREILYKISCDYSVDINRESYLYDTVEKIKNKYING
jgi:shikimate kinase